MKSIIVAVFSLVVCHVTSVLATDHAWTGEYYSHEYVEQEGEWTFILSIDECTKDGCKYHYSGGSNQSLCSAEGVAAFKKPGVLEERIDLTKDYAKDEPRGYCTITLTEEKDGDINVDASPDYAKSKDKKYGDPCNNLCGNQGVRYFDISLPKVSDKKYFNPSFVCHSAKKLNATENEICTNEKLANLDRELGAIYSNLTESNGHPEIKKSQQDWLKNRNQKCKDGETKRDCLTKLYEQRLAELKSKSSA